MLSLPSFSLTQTEVAKLLASDGKSPGRFGISVSVNGDTALIGAPLDEDHTGAAYVYVRTGGVWTEQAKLLASDGASEDWFGSSVSIDDDTAVIGAFLENNWTGSAYVFIRTGGVWTEQKKLTSSDGATEGWFGRSVSVDGDTAVIGAPRDHENGFDAGAAYVYVRTGGVWTEQAKLLASDGEEDDSLGFAGSSVSLSGNTAVIGASGDDDNGSAAGAAYVFTIPVTVNIDIKPNKKTENIVNLKKGKHIKIAIIGNADLDALQIDPLTVKFGPSESDPIRYKGRDYNKDGFADLILTFRIEETGIACGDTEATLTGQTFPDPVINFAGSDTITVEPCP